MSRWKTAFESSLDPDRQTLEMFEFGPPATESELAALETAAGAPLPAELRDLLAEFNGVYDVRGSGRETYYFPTTEMTTAAEYYREWDWPTDMLLDGSKNILYVCQENGISEMWGVVAKPFASFRTGQVIAFDHDEIAFAETPEELFAVPYESLLDLVAAKYKSSRAE